MHAFRQTVSLTSSAVRSIPQRLGASLVTVVGITVVMAVLVSLLALGQGVAYLAKTGARADRASVLSHGVQSATQSSIPRASLGIVQNAPGTRKDSRGRALAAGALALSADAITTNNQRASVGIFAMTPIGEEVWPEIKIIEGRRFQPGLHEVIVSDNVRRRFKGYELAGHARIRGTDWTIVGVFAPLGGFFDNTIIADAETVMSAFTRTTFTGITVVIEPGQYETFKRAIEGDPTLSADVKTEAQANEQIVGQLKNVLDFVSYFVGGIMALGAVCGALASLYAAVDSRKREIATLRAIGFSAFPIVVAVLAEALILAIPAALLGAAIAWLMFNGHVVAALGLTFPLTVSVHALNVSIFWSIAIALIGGFLPAIRAARLPVATALRAS